MVVEVDGYIDIFKRMFKFKRFFLIIYIGFVQFIKFWEDTLKDLGKRVEKKIRGNIRQGIRIKGVFEGKGRICCFKYSKL